METNIGLITARGISYKNEIKTIKKKIDEPLQPVYEAFMNSWEAILDKFTDGHINQGQIKIHIHKKENLFSNETGQVDFDRIVVEDNGLGLDEKSYKRLIDLRDDSKHHSNLGTGRIQYIHFFESTQIDSVYRSANNEFRKRCIRLSKCESFLNKNAIMSLEADDVSEEKSSRTIVSFFQPLDEKDLYYYSGLNLEDLKNEMIRHFLSLFCENRNQLPQIFIDITINDRVFEEGAINSSDIPAPDKENKKLELQYSKLDDKNRIVDADKKALFHLKAFKRPGNEIKQNAIYLVSKGALGITIDLDSLQKNEEIDGNRYMFLLSGDYLDNSDRDDRGNILLVKSQDFKHQNENSLFPEEVILLDTIVQGANRSINSLYEEFEEKNKEKNLKIDELQKMFLLNQNIVDKVRGKVRISDSDERILKLVYEAESEIEAEKDNEIKMQLSEIKKILPSRGEHYLQDLNRKADELMSTIPIQNRNSLSKYVARRKIILQLFGHILEEAMKLQKEGKEINESLFHNLIFQQASSCESPEDSDLWLINEEYIYFKGVSDTKFDNVLIEGKPLFKKDLTEEELNYKTKCGKDAGNRKPDILLFPQEGKCIIIEFKSPRVDVSFHLDQINRYARLIHNLSDPSFHFNTYYGFLIGEQGIDIDEIKDANPYFISAGYLDFIFRPHFPVVGKFNRGNGDLYTEVIKYSTLLERAKLRNKIFIEKLTKSTRMN